jgi:hypothetical protein
MNKWYLPVNEIGSALEMGLIGWPMGGPWLAIETALHDTQGNTIDVNSRPVKHGRTLAPTGE